MTESESPMLDTSEWTEAFIKGSNKPCMKISVDVGGLTMIALWVRTDSLIEIGEEK